MDKNDLAQAFCHDCNKRRLRVSEIVQGGMPLNRVQLDQLHQEFDTLYGGARAVHLPDLERFFRGMARYARYLRNRQRLGLEVGPQSWQRLMLGVEIWFRCSAELSCCFVYSNSDRLPLLQEMENKIDNGDAK
jgi:hypothetical protein